MPTSSKDTTNYELSLDKKTAEDFQKENFEGWITSIQKKDGSLADLKKLTAHLESIAKKEGALVDKEKPSATGMFIMKEGQKIITESSFIVPIELLPEEFTNKITHESFVAHIATDGNAVGIAILTKEVSSEVTLSKAYDLISIFQKQAETDLFIDPVYLGVQLYRFEQSETTFDINPVYAQIDIQSVTEFITGLEFNTDVDDAIIIFQRDEEKSIVLLPVYNQANKLAISKEEIQIVLNPIFQAVEIFSFVDVDTDIILTPEYDSEDIVVVGEFEQVVEFSTDVDFFDIQIQQIETDLILTIIADQEEAPEHIWGTTDHEWEISPIIWDGRLGFPEQEETTITLFGFYDYVDFRLISQNESTVLLSTDYDVIELVEMVSSDSQIQLSTNFTEETIVVPVEFVSEINIATEENSFTLNFTDKNVNIELESEFDFVDLASVAEFISHIEVDTSFEKAIIKSSSSTFTLSTEYEAEEIVEFVGSQNKNISVLSEYEQIEASDFNIFESNILFDSNVEIEILAKISKNVNIDLTPTYDVMLLRDITEFESSIETTTDPTLIGLFMIEEESEIVFDSQFDVATAFTTEEFVSTITVITSTNEFKTDFESAETTMGVGGEYVQQNRLTFAEFESQLSFETNTHEFLTTFHEYISSIEFETETETFEQLLSQPDTTLTVSSTYEQIDGVIETSFESNVTFIRFATAINRIIETEFVQTIECSTSVDTNRIDMSSFISEIEMSTDVSGEFRINVVDDYVVGGWQSAPLFEKIQIGNDSEFITRNSNHPQNSCGLETMWPISGLSEFKIGVIAESTGAPQSLTVEGGDSWSPTGGDIKSISSLQEYVYIIPTQFMDENDVICYLSAASASSNLLRVYQVYFLEEF